MSKLAGTIPVLPKIILLIASVTELLESSSTSKKDWIFPSTTSVEMVPPALFTAMTSGVPLSNEAPCSIDPG